MQFSCNCPAGSPFHWRDGEQAISWKKLNENKALSATNSAKVERMREEGVDNSTIHGLTKKPAQRKKPNAAYSVTKLLREASILANKHGGQYSRAKAKA